MDTIILKDAPFLIIGRSGQENILTQEIVDKYNSIAINVTKFNVDMIFRADRPWGYLYSDKCKYFFTDEKYKKHSDYQGEKFRFFKSEYKIVSDALPVLGLYRFTFTLALNYIALVKPKSEVYLVGIDHSKGKYRDKTVKTFVDRYKDLLTIYQTDFNSDGWNLEYKEIK